MKIVLEIDRLWDDAGVKRDLKTEPSFNPSLKNGVPIREWSRAIQICSHEN